MQLNYPFTSYVKLIILIVIITLLHIYKIIKLYHLSISNFHLSII